MYNIAIDVLCVPATPAPVERVFNRASYILSKKDYDWYTSMHIICKNCIYAIVLACIYAYEMQYAFVFEYAICYAYAFNMNMQYAIFAYCIFGYKQLVRSCVMCCRNSKRLNRIVTESELMIKVNRKILME